MHCPFCGDDEGVRPLRLDVGMAISYVITCDNCGARGPSEETLTTKTVAMNLASDRWNNRISHEQDVALRTAFTMT